MVENKISVKNSVGEKLVGLENQPDKVADKNPAMILVHGFAADKNERQVFINLARELTARNIFVYRFDLSGCGESEGDYSKTTLTKLAGDVGAVTDYVKNLSYIDAARIGFIGFSLGVPTLLALKPSEARCLVFMSGVATPRPILEKLFGAGYQPASLSERLTVAGRLVKVRPEFWSDFDNYNILDVLKNWPVPILVVNNQGDEIVPPVQADMLVAAASGPKQKITLPDSGHAIEDAKVFPRIADWCLINLKD
jgi:pimeloyl-ACP methyl ester carboxylesterase